jgi:hypothetical protein
MPGPLLEGCVDEGTLFSAQEPSVAEAVGVAVLAPRERLLVLGALGVAGRSPAGEPRHLLDLRRGMAGQVLGGLVVIVACHEHGGVAHLVPGEHPLGEGLSQAGELIQRGTHAHPLLRGAIRDVQHTDQPRRHRRGAIDLPVLLAISGGDHVEHLRGRGDHQRAQLLDRHGTLPVRPLLESGDALGGSRPFSRCGHSILLRARCNRPKRVRWYEVLGCRGP